METFESQGLCYSSFTYTVLVFSLGSLSRLKRLEDNVHTLVSPKDVVDTVNVSERVASLIYNYWKMKRRVGKDNSS